MSDQHSFVDGAPSPGSAGEAAIFNPSNGEQIATVSRAGAGDVDRSVELGTGTTRVSGAERRFDNDVMCCGLSLT